MKVSKKRGVQIRQAEPKGSILLEEIQPFAWSATFTHLNDTPIILMAILNILTFPDKRLRTVAQPVEQVDDNIKTLIEDMLETMYAAPGIGLAATQVNVHKRILVLDVSEDHNEPMVFINPTIKAHEGEQAYEEGCLSVPGYYESIDRFQSITVSALDREGEPFELQCDGLMSVCIQHEIDHLEGKLFVDYLSNLKKQRIKKKLLKAAP